MVLPLSSSRSSPPRIVGRRHHDMNHYNNKHSHHPNHRISTGMTPRLCFSKTAILFYRRRKSIISFIILLILALYLHLLRKTHRRFQILNDDDMIRDDHHSPEALLSLFIDHNRRKQKWNYLKNGRRRRSASSAISPSSSVYQSLVSSLMPIIRNASNNIDDNDNSQNDNNNGALTTALIRKHNNNNNNPSMNPFLLLEMKNQHNKNDQYVYNKDNDEIHDVDNEVARIYNRRGSWDSSPIVVEEYRLVFFTQGKVACTVFKQLFRKMMHLDDWYVHKEPNLPHNPKANGLKYLYDFNPDQAYEMMTSPTWTRAIFVRDPKERLLSAFLDKVQRKEGNYVTKHCCHDEMMMVMNGDDHLTCGQKASKSLRDFMNIIQSYQGCTMDSHWVVQTNRIPSRFWSYVNFIGHFGSLQDDTRSMLHQLSSSHTDLWNEFGFDGWGPYHNESIFAVTTSAKHETNAKSKLCGYFGNEHINDAVEEFYQQDYEHPMFNFTPTEVIRMC